MKTADLIGPALDWAVAKCEGLNTYIDLATKIGGVFIPLRVVSQGYNYAPSTNWAQGGPIIEREHVGVKYAGHDASGPLFAAWKSHGLGPHKNESSRYGPTPLIAAMRCYVASKLGDDVDVPKETHAAN